VDLPPRQLAPENWGRDLGGSSRKSAAHAETVANLEQLRCMLYIELALVYGGVYPGVKTGRDRGRVKRGTVSDGPKTNQ
jgi:hypothetical protein